MPDTEATRTPGAWGWATLNGKPFREHRLMAGDTDIGGNTAIGYYDQGHVSDEEHEANRAFIVRAVNAHDALLAAALGALERCIACGHERQRHGERDCVMCAERDVLDACRTFRVDEGLRAAVALAEEAHHG